ncbi:MAG TPA: hypothetical protein VI703_09090 [Anaerolineales bacterium]|nr:hypothetical protein [Anaerolineales bacterium]
MDWRERVDRELATAEAAKTRGNEGMARVCARRAAGWTVQAYLANKGIDLESSSVLEQMRTMLKIEGLGLESKRILEHMLVAKEEGEDGGDSYFPLDVDLVAEARQLVAELFP